MSRVPHTVTLTWDGDLAYGPTITITCPPDCDTYVWSVDETLTGTDNCHCADRGDGVQCDACADGDHDACAWGFYIYDVDASCRCVNDPKSCWFAHMADAVGAEAFSFAGSLKFVALLDAPGDDGPIHIDIDTSSEALPDADWVKGWREWSTSQVKGTRGDDES